MVVVMMMMVETYFIIVDSLSGEFSTKNLFIYLFCYPGYSIVNTAQCVHQEMTVVWWLRVIIQRRKVQNIYAERALLNWLLSI